MDTPKKVRINPPSTVDAIVAPLKDIGTQLKNHAVLSKANAVYYKKRQKDMALIKKRHRKEKRKASVLSWLFAVVFGK